MRVVLCSGQTHVTTDNAHQEVCPAVTHGAHEEMGSCPGVWKGEMVESGRAVRQFFCEFHGSVSPLQVATHVHEECNYQRKNSTERAELQAAELWKAVARNNGTGVQPCGTCRWE